MHSQARLLSGTEASEAWNFLPGSSSGAERTGYRRPGRGSVSIYAHRTRKKEKDQGCDVRSVGRSSRSMRQAVACSVWEL